MGDDVYSSVRFHLLNWNGNHQASGLLEITRIHEDMKQVKNLVQQNQNGV